MVVSPADHVYTNPGALRQAIGLAVAAAAAGPALVTLGITPSRPETGYGYIELVGEAEASASAGPTPPPGVRRAARFVEKPDLATAAGYLSSGRFLWNSGVFAWKVSSILRQIEICAPDLWRDLKAIDAALGRPDEERVIAQAFASMASISIDYAVMEKTRDVLVVPVDPGWSDVGSWDAAAELHATDAAGNAFAGDAGAADHVLNVGSRDCFVYTSGGSGRPIALVNVEDLIVVDAGDALLICRKGDSQSVRAVVEALKARGRQDLL
jgi:mannose-1-phosphate guanylyltransferase